MSAIQVNINLDSTKGYPILNSVTGNPEFRLLFEFQFLFDQPVSIGDKLLFNKHIYNIDSIIDTRNPKGEAPDSVMFYKTKCTIEGRVEKNKAGELILIAV